MFGGTSLFGKSPQQPSLFGGASQAPSATGGLFGSQPGGGLFGQQQPQQQPSAFGQQPSAFGQQPQQQPSAFGQQPAGGIFGAQPAGGSSSSLFGQPAAAGGGSGLFGQQQQQQPSMFGQQQQQQQQPSMFGQQQQPSLFGQQQQPSMFGQQQQQPSIFPHQQQQQQQQLTPMDQAVRDAEISAPYWYRELVGIQAAYRICRFSKFQTLLYETIPAVSSPQQLEKVKQDRRAVFFQNVPWLDSREWQRMEENNPDPARWNPFPLIGIDMLAKRAEKQNANAKDQLEQNLDWIESCQQNLQIIREKVAAAKRRYVELHSKLIACLGRLERLQARRIVSGPRTPQELEFRKRLDAVRESVCNPSDGLFTKVLQLDAGLLALTSRSAAAMDEDYDSSSSLATSPDEEKRNELIMQFLEEQAKSLAVVMDVLRRDAREIKLIKAKMLS